MADLFFVLSKVFWAFARPDHLLLLLLTLGLWLTRPPRSLQPTLPARFRLGRRTLWTAAGLLWLLALYPVGNLLYQPLETRFPRPALPPAAAVAGVVVLGGAEQVELSHHWGSLEVNTAAERDLALLALLRRYPRAPVIFTGGSGDLLDQRYRGADAVRGFLQPLGLAGRVRFERRSRNTYENALYSKPLADLERPGAWLLVTSAFHMPRAVGVFRQQGWPVRPYPVDYHSLPVAWERWGFDLAGHLADLDWALREWIGLFAYYLTGKTSALVPAPWN